MFGDGVSLNVGLQWNGSIATLLLNSQHVKSTRYKPATANWNAVSDFDLGASEYQTYGGYNSSDDFIRQFTVTSPALLQINGEPTELAGSTSGSNIAPSTAPTGLTGKLVRNGAGSVNFVPGSGV